MPVGAFFGAWRRADGVPPKVASAPQFRRLAIALAALLACLAPDHHETAAGFQIRIQVLGPGDALQAPDDAERLVPPQDRDAESWLKRAEEAAAREDWKLAADTLARVIAEHGHKTVSLDEGRHYYSAASRAQEQLSAWPADGLATYRVLYDGEAERLFELATIASDLHPLRTIARQYPQTSIGPRAINLLATWLLDRGEAAEAIDVLSLLSILPHSEVPRFDALQKLAIAYTLTHQRERVSETLMEMRRLVEAADPADADFRRDRLEATQRFFEAAKFGRSADAGPRHYQPWTHLLGPAGESGRAPAINPVITADVPWHDALPGADRIDENVIRRVMERTGRPPVWQAVTDGSMLFVSTPGGIVARDLATFDFLWQSFPASQPRDPRITRFRFRTGGREPKKADSLDRLSTRTLFHEYAGAVSTAFGLVFAIDQAETLGEQLPSRRGVVRPQTSFGEALANENSLRAFEAVTGRAVWTKGRAGPVEDDLKEAHFFSTPVVAGPFLVAPFQLRQDLYLAVIQPDGTLVKRVLIGSARPGMLPYNAVLQPVVADGTVFVNTGAGLFVALNAVDFSLRWLTAYDRADNAVRSRRARRRRGWVGFNSGRELSQPDEWLCSPPVVVGGLVLLAPHDAEYLFAFDRRDGVEKWRSDRHNHRYIVGADAQRVVVAGRRVAALDLRTGEEAWSYRDDRPTGRPVLTGDQVLVPSADGLVTLDVETGTPVGPPVKAAATLGNLFVTDESLYSITPNEMRKFPDTERTRSLAEQRLAKDPNDIEAVVRLAWLAGLDDDWRRALDLLDEAVPAADRHDPSDQASRSAGRVSHLRVTSLLRLAETESPPQRGDLLARAATTARRPDDVVNAGLAYADHLAEQGEHMAGFRRAIELLRDTGDVSVQLEPGLFARAGVLIAEHLRRYAANMNEDHGRQARDHLRELLESARAADDWRAVERLADGVPFVDVGARADLRLAGADLREGRYESAVFHLERVSRRAAGTDLAAEALARLAVVLARPGEGLPAAPAEAARVLARLESQYADRTLPSDLFDSPDLADVRSVDAFVRVMAIGRPAAGLVTRTPRRSGRPRLRVVHQDVDAITPSRRTRVFYDPNLEDRRWADVLPVRFTRQLQGIRTGNDNVGELTWANAVASAAKPVDRQNPQLQVVWINADPNAQAAPDPPEVHHAAVAGRIAALDLGDQIYAVGLVSGRCMWRPLVVDRESGDLPQPPVIAVNGIIIAAANAQSLVAIRARDDARPIWRRRFAKRRLGRLAVAGDWLVVVDRGGALVSVVDPVSGRDVRAFGLVAGEAPTATDDSPADWVNRDAHVAIAGGTILRSGPKTVVARDLGTGRELWSKKFRGRVKDIRALGERHVGVNYRGERYAVLRADTGETIKEIEAEGLDLPPIHATLDWPGPDNNLRQGRLLIFSKTDDDPAEFKIVSYPLDDSEPWTQGPYEAAHISPRMMAASSRVLPVLLYHLRKRDNQQVLGEAVRQISLTSLVLLDKSTGRRIADRFAFDDEALTEPGAMFNRTGSKEISDVIMLDRRLIAIGPHGYCILEKTPAPPPVSAHSSSRMENP